MASRQLKPKPQSKTPPPPVLAPRKLLPLPATSVGPSTSGVVEILGRALLSAPTTPAKVHAPCAQHPEDCFALASSLNDAGLRWTKGYVRSLRGLDEMFARGQYVLARTHIANLDHWIVLDGGNSSSLYTGTCPELGRLHWKPRFVLEAWERQDFEHIVVPASPFAHLRAHEPIHEQTFAQFVNHAQVVLDENQTQVERGAIREASARLSTIMPDPIYEIAAPFGQWRFFRSPPAVGDAPSGRLGPVVGELVATHRSDPSTPVGIISRGVPFVRPEMRGLGIGLGMVLAAHRDGPHRYLRPSGLSESGLAARVRAHAHAIHEALSEGLVVEQKVIQSNPILTPGAPGPWDVRRESRRAASPETQGDMFGSPAPA